MATNGEVQKGWEYLDAIPRYRRVDANAHLMSHAIHAEDKTITTEILHQLFNRIKPKLAFNREYLDTYRVFFEKHPEYRSDANMGILDEALVKLKESVTAENLELLLEPGNPHNVLDKLGLTEEARQARAEEAERQVIITALVDGLRPFVDERGRKALTNSSGFRVLYKDEVGRIKALPLEALRQLRDEKAEKKRLQQMSPEEVRQVVRQNITPVSRYEQIPDLYYPPGKDVGVRWSFDLFKRLPSMEQRRLLEHYGNDALTAACAAGRNLNV
jgi:hypothetical protein